MFLKIIGRAAGRVVRCSSCCCNPSGPRVLNSLPTFALPRTKLIEPRSVGNLISERLALYSPLFIPNCKNSFSTAVCTSSANKQENTKENRTFQGALTVIGGLLVYTMVNRMIEDNGGSENPLFTSVAHNSPLVSKDDDSTSKRKSMAYNFIADAVEIAAPAVVYIEVTSQRAHEHFFRSAGPTSSGSGFIVNENGMIITNAHVVADSSKVTVKLRDGRTRNGVVVDTDQVSDLAAVQLLPEHEEKYPFLKLGESSKIRAGEFVAALGSPLQLTNTITAGIVSTIHRAGEELGLPNRDMAYIQTDAAINVGNSGGPLVNLDAEVIGINCITVMAASGISFAIPSDVARKFLASAEAKVEKVGREGISRAGKDHGRYYIGITMLTLNPAIVEELKQRSTKYSAVERGVFVPRVSFRSPAERAGMVTGDVIISINGQAVSNAREVYDAVRKGEQLTVEVQRGTKTIFLQIKPSPVARL